MLDRQTDSAPEKWRARCYRCHRPADRCFCETIPSIRNKTNVLILQHKRERFHPFNTARIVNRSLLNSKLLVDNIDRLAVALSKVHLSQNVGLLYPGPSSLLLDDIPVNRRPDQLVVLDGTWHHSKTLIREIAQLRSLPRYRLAPVEPSRYEIRREPNAQFLSTLEATVAALKILEPDTVGFNELLSAFHGMIDNQIRLPQSNFGARRNHRHRENRLNIPGALVNDLENIVVVYGETSPGSKMSRDLRRRGIGTESSIEHGPVYWVAQRLVTGERFESAIKPSTELSTTFLSHLDLPPEVFETAPSMDTFRESWEAFLRPKDRIAFYFSNISKLLSVIAGSYRSRFHLKSVRLNERNFKTLDDLLDQLSINSPTTEFSGRAGKRLSSTIALSEYLHNYASRHTTLQ